MQVLLSSIWLLLREERGRERELASGLPYNTNVQSPIKRTPLETTKCKCLHTEAIKKTLPEITTQRKYLHAETQTDDRITETHSLISEKIVNQRKQDDDKSRKLVCPLDGSLDSFHITNVGRRKRVCSNADSTSNDKEDKDRVSNTAKIQPFVTEIAHLDGDRIISGNKLFGLNEVQNHVLDKAGTDLTAVDSTCTSKSRLLESVFESPPVLSPIKAITIPKEPSDDNLLSKSDTKDKAQNSNLPSAVIEGYSNDVNSAITETGAAPHKGLETIVNTSDSNIFQISSNDGLTYESIMIENVGSEDSDTQMTIDYDDPKVDSTKTSMKLSLDNDNITQHKYEKKGKTEQKQLVRNSHQNFAAIHNCALDVATNADIVIENLETGPPEPSVRESFGGIVEPDSDSELKIINIAGGVTFYDDPDQDDLPNDGNIDYVEKPGVSVYNPFVYSGFPSNQSSNTSPYSDVVYSSYTSFPSTYMNPRLTVQNCPQYFFPNNLNMGMYVGANEAGQIYQPVDNQTKYGNIPPSFNQGFQYYFPQPKKTDLSEPVEVKSETRAITATSPKSTKKKRKKELEEEPLSPNKEYYNVRDKNGKFIKMEEMPYINNVNHSSFSLKGHKPGMKNPVNQEQKAGGLFDDANCSFARLMRYMIKKHYFII